MRSLHAIQHTLDRTNDRGSIQQIQIVDMAESEYKAHQQTEPPGERQPNLPVSVVIIIRPDTELTTGSVEGE